MFVLSINNHSINQRAIREDLSSKELTLSQQPNHTRSTSILKYTRLRNVVPQAFRRRPSHVRRCSSCPGPIHDRSVHRTSRREKSVIPHNSDLLSPCSILTGPDVWCNDERSTCPLLCLQYPGNSMTTNSNDCDPVRYHSRASHNYI